MTEEQIRELARRVAAYEKASRALRKLLVEMFPVGSRVRIRSKVVATVVSHGGEIPVLHAESNFGRHRVTAADLIPKRGGA